MNPQRFLPADQYEEKREKEPSQTSKSICLQFPAPTLMSLLLLESFKGINKISSELMWYKSEETVLPGI